MRNYTKFWLTSGHYDDGFGGSIIFTNFFESEAQRNQYFEASTFLNPVWNVDQHVWIWLNKRDVGTLANMAYGSTELSPGQIDPLYGLSFSTPNGEWGEWSEFFVRASQDPIR